MQDVSPGFGEVKLDAAGPVKVTAKVAFAKDVALGTAPGAPAAEGHDPQARTRRERQGRGGEGHPGRRQGRTT